MQTFELGAFLKNHLEAYKQYARQKNIDLTVITDFATYITVNADQTKIKSLISGILKTTIDHSKATVINFSIRQLLRSDKEILLEFSLEDDGCIAGSGEKFSYFRSLVVARSLIEELNGKSELILSPEKGAVLKFVIGCELKHDPKIRSSYKSFSHLKGKKVLIVDDNEMNQKIIYQFLKNEDIECSISSDGIKAIELLEQNNAYDLILLDILLPRMDGIETAGYIRKKLESTVPIIAMPARDKSWIEPACFHTGINHVLKKPFAARDLLELINSTLAPAHSTTEFQQVKIA